MGLGWTHSPKSVFPVFFLIVLEGIFNLVSIIAIFKGQTWKERKKKKKRQGTNQVLSLFRMESA